LPIRDLANQVAGFCLAGAAPRSGIGLQAGIDQWLADHYRQLDRWIVKSWECFGLGESEVATELERPERLSF